MATTWYTTGVALALSGGLDVVNDQLDALALDAVTTTPDNPDHEFIDDIVADEVTDGSYARVTLTNVALAVNATDNRAEIDSDDIVFTALENGGVSVKFIVIAQIVTTDADSKLLTCHDTADTVPDGTNLTYAPGSAGFAHGRTS